MKVKKFAGAFDRCRYDFLHYCLQQKMRQRLRKAR